jgi:hypothetical protein
VPDEEWLAMRLPLETILCILSIHCKKCALSGKILMYNNMNMNNASYILQQKPFYMVPGKQNLEITKMEAG